MSPAIRNSAAAIVFTLLVVALWQAVVEAGLVNRLFLAAPSQAFAVIVERAGPERSGPPYLIRRNG